MTSEPFGYRADDTHPFWIRLLRDVAAFAFFLLFTVILLWPLATHLDTAVPDLGDPLLNTWILDWDLYSITNAPTHIYDANIFHPSKYPLAYSENLFGIAIVALPFYLLGFTPLAVYNIAVLLGFAFCGYGAFVLGRVLTRSVAGGLVAGILYSFVNFRIDHLSHLQFVWGGWMPIMLAALLHYWRRPTIRNAILYGLCVLMNGLTNIHQFLFGTTALVLSVALLALLTTRFKWRTLIGAAMATILAVALMVPVLLPYKIVSETYGMVRDRGAVMWGSANWTDWLSAAVRSRTYGDIPKPANVLGEKALFPGLMMLFLAASALLMDRRKLPVVLDARPVPRWLLHVLDAVIVAMAIGAYVGAATRNYQWRLLGHTIVSFQTTSKPASSDIPMVILIVMIMVRLSLQLPKGLSGETLQSLRTAAARSRVPIEVWVLTLWIVLGVLGSLGLHAFVHTFLFNHFQMFRSMRVPASWATLAYVGLAGASACGVAAWIDGRRTKIGRWGVAVLLIALAVHDVLPMIRWEHALEITDPAYVWMRDTKITGGTLEMPVSEGVAKYLYQLGATIHHKPLMNGTSGFEPPLYSKILEMAGRKKIPDELLPLLARNDCHFLLVHDDWLRGASDTTHVWLEREMALGRIGFVRRFDHRGGGDYVFAVTSNEPRWRDLRPPEKGDGAGLTEELELQRALRGEPTYVGRTFGVVDTPHYDETIKGPMTVDGWALSPNGIASVDVLLHNGMYRFHTTRTVRFDVMARFPWYPHLRDAGFRLTFARRPRGVPPRTDAQVEVIDRRGGRTRLPDIVLNWPSGD